MLARVDDLITRPSHRNIQTNNPGNSVIRIGDNNYESCSGFDEYPITGAPRSPLMQQDHLHRTSSSSHQDTQYSNEYMLAKFSEQGMGC